MRTPAPLSAAADRAAPMTRSQLRYELDVAPDHNVKRMLLPSLIAKLRSVIRDRGCLGAVRA
jgi:hypothetical protein